MVGAVLQYLQAFLVRRLFAVRDGHPLLASAERVNRRVA